jgi:hypothetical protein
MTDIEDRRNELIMLRDGAVDNGQFGAAVSAERALIALESDADEQGDIADCRQCDLVLAHLAPLGLAPEDADVVEVARLVAQRVREQHQPEAT